MSAEVLLELRDVTVPSRRNPAGASIPGLNWTVRAGEFWVVGGHQGSGKSGLIFMLAGLTQPLGGSYTLLGQEMGRDVGDEILPNRARLGVVFNEARLFGHLTIAENVALPACYHHNLHADEAESWVEALLQATGILKSAAQLPSSLGFSTRRRAGLARALALRPEVLFLENPLRGLDARDCAWWTRFLQELWRGHDLMRGRPMTVIASTDEFRPWRKSGAQFAILHERNFEVVGERAPEDDVTMSHPVAAEEK